MPSQNFVEVVSPRGSVVLRAADGSHVLAQQIDAKPLRVGQALEGSLDEFGMGAATDAGTGMSYEFFVEAWGLSREAALFGVR